MRDSAATRVYDAAASGVGTNSPEGSRWFAGLFDDAAIFPPGNAPLSEALRAHRRIRLDARARYAGPFLCSAAAVVAGDLLDEMTGVDLALSIVATRVEELPPAIELVRGSSALRLCGVEARAQDSRGAIGEVASRLRALVPTLSHRYLEIPIGPALADDLEALHAHDLRAKLRLGGITAQAFPTEDALAEALSILAARRVPFKLTAGLHRAVRHTDPSTGFEHHGFVNVLVAVAVALQSGGDGAMVTAALAERDPEGVVSTLRNLAPAEVQEARTLFTSFGTCSIDEPIADLVALGLIGSPRGLQVP